MSFNLAQVDAAEVIGEGKAAGYQSIIEKDENEFIWSIGHDNNTLTLIENETNSENLERFRIIVNDLDILMFEVISYSIFLLIVVFGIFIFQKKLKGGIPILVITAFGLFAFYHTFNSALELNAMLKEAQYYYY